jgi:hypothetical protein
MPELFPAKLTIPASQNVKYDFTCENNTTVADFRQQVLDNTDSSVSSFELLRARDPPNKGSNDNTSIDDITLGELKAQKFRMQVNNKIYHVYPDLISILKREDENQTSAKKGTKKSSPTAEETMTEQMATSIPIGRAAILKDFYAHLLASMKKETKTGG